MDRARFYDTRKLSPSCRITSDKMNEWSGCVDIVGFYYMQEVRKRVLILSKSVEHHLILDGLVMRGRVKDLCYRESLIGWFLEKVRMIVVS